MSGCSALHAQQQQQQDEQRQQVAKASHLMHATTSVLPSKAPSPANLDRSSIASSTLAYKNTNLNTHSGLPL
jgi:hypothetical protein